MLQKMDLHLKRVKMLENPLPLDFLKHQIITTLFGDQTTSPTNLMTRLITPSTEVSQKLKRSPDQVKKSSIDHSQ